MDGIALPRNYKEAITIQENLRKQVVLLNDFPDPPFIIGGLDVGYNIKTGEAKAALVIMKYKTLEVMESFTASVPVSFPYIPGLLSFREIPAIIEVFKNLPTLPDLVLVDGHGISHPRRLGIASHVGVTLDIATIGVAKKKLFGIYEEPLPTKGSHTALTDGDETIGCVFRSKNNVKPLFISAGHKISLESAVAITSRCLTSFRLPEPTRLADKLSKYSKDDFLL